VTEPSQAPEIGLDLVEKAKTGDSEALRELATRAYPLVRRWALVRTGDAADADDLTQDVLVQVIQRLDSFHGSARFDTWLYTVTRNASTDRFRRGGRRHRAQDDPRSGSFLAPDPPPSPDAAADQGLLARVIRAFFEELPDRQREVFDLAELQGFSSTEISERLGIEAVSVRASLFKARRALRSRILQNHPELAEEWI
jgi:RNA polymerase sigma-70 factor (ECF subfamily)